MAAFIGVGVLSALVVAAVRDGRPTQGLVEGLLVVAPLAALCHWLESWLAHAMAYRLLADMRIALFSKLERLAPAYLLQRRSGDLVALATQDVEMVEYFYAHTIAPAIVSVLVPITVSRVGTENDLPAAGGHPRIENAAYALELSERGIRSMVVRFAPTVHGAGGDHGFVAILARIAREKGISAFIGEGRNRWPAVHRLDAGKLVRLAIDKAAPGTVLHAIAEEGIATRDIAAALGHFLDVPVESLPIDLAQERFDWLSLFFGADVPASSARTRAALGWEPTHPTLLEDIAAGHYPGQ